MENNNQTKDTKDEGTQTEETHPPVEVTGSVREEKLKVIEKPRVTEDKCVNTAEEVLLEETPTRPVGNKIDPEKTPEATEDDQNTARAGWWRRPFYYFG